MNQRRFNARWRLPFPALLFLRGLAAPEAGAAGKVKKAPRPVVVATPPPRKPSFFERLFGVRPKPAPAPPTPPLKQRPVRR